MSEIVIDLTGDHEFCGVGRAVTSQFGGRWRGREEVDLPQDAA